MRTATESRLYQNEKSVTAVKTRTAQDTNSNSVRQTENSRKHLDFGFGYAPLVTDKHTVPSTSLMTFTNWLKSSVTGGTERELSAVFFRGITYRQNL